MQVAFIGLGVMGAPMAGHLARAGHDVVVYNRTTAKAQLWVEQYGGRRAATPAAAAAGADCVMLCVGNDGDVRSVVHGADGVLGAMKRGALLVDHTTTSAELAEELARAGAERSVGFLDAPVSGGQAGAEKGVLTIMVGGDEADYAAAEPLLGAYGRTVRLIGPVGYGQKCKMVNQICIAGLLQALSEGVAFAKFAGLDVARVVDVLHGGAAQSWQMDNRALTMAEGRFDFGFAIDWMRKDLGICLDEAGRIGAQLPVTAAVDGFYRELQEGGDGRADTSALIKRLAGG